MTAILSPDFVLRLTPGVTPEVVDSSTWSTDRLPQSFLFTRSPTSRHVSDDGRYLVYVSGEYFRESDPHSGAPSVQEILNGFRKDGTAYFQTLSGSWRVAIIDTANLAVWIATDRFGAQRVCYRHQADGSFVASDRAEVVASLAAEKASLDPTSLFQYFFFHCIPSPATAFSGVSALGPATCLHLEDALTVERYWRPSFNLTRSSDLSPEELLQALRTSVHETISTERFGAFLSGGLDSSTVVGFAAQQPDTELTAYTIGFDEPDYDETEYAKLAASTYGVPISIYNVTPEDILKTIDIVARSFDEPFGNSSAIPTYHCAAFAVEDGQSILLAGDGGDELFSGNERYRTQQIFSWYQGVPGFLRKGVLEPLFLGPLARTEFFPIRKVRRYIEQAKMPMPERMQTYNFLLRDGLSTIFTDVFLDAADTDAPFDHLQSVWDEAPECDFIDRMLYLDWKLTLADNDLRKVTTMCDAAGIRVAYPMLTNSLLKAACDIPGAKKMLSGKLRGFYKSATRDFLPNEILTKKKHGFGLPFGPWFKKSSMLRDSVLDRLTSLAKRNIVRQDYIDEMCRVTIEEHAGYFGEIIWVMTILESWLSARSEYADFRL
ncbi:MAG: asparagine synthase-related protein [Woeseiaceae bacterium]|nr:asparagine synthase-related protein [Woeseiaceae bacterium]